MNHVYLNDSEAFFCFYHLVFSMSFCVCLHIHIYRAKEILLDCMDWTHLALLVYLNVCGFPLKIIR